MKFKRLRDDACLPEQAHPGDAGYDLISPDSIILAPMQKKLVSTGIAVAIPEGFVGLVCPRSGLALKMGITVLNAPGIIDSGYRGEVGVILVNLSSQDVSLPKKTKVAQLVVVPFRSDSPEWADNLDQTKRGEDGFGSTTLHKISDDVW